MVRVKSSAPGLTDAGLNETITGASVAELDTSCTVGTVGTANDVAAVSVALPSITLPNASTPSVHQRTQGARRTKHTNQANENLSIVARAERLKIFITQQKKVKNQSHGNNETTICKYNRWTSVIIISKPISQNSNRAFATLLFRTQTLRQAQGEDSIFPHAEP
jgi:hypothetical protein